MSQAVAKRGSLGKPQYGQSLICSIVERFEQAVHGKK